MALIGLDGHFRELNPRFCEKVGYAEWEFRKAMWPSVSDRRNLEAHRELMRSFSAGDLDEAPVETCYMHKQGLLVPMAGAMSLVRDAEGEPLPTLFAGVEPDDAP